MKKIKDTITLIEENFSFICPLKTEDMHTVEGGFFCDKCEKKVHDVSNYSQEEFKSLTKNSDNVCVSFKQVLAVSLVLGFSACAVAETKVETSSPRPAVENNNSLKPFTPIDKNETIVIDRLEPVAFLGEIDIINVPVEYPIPIKENNNSLQPFTPIDKNQTITIEKVEYEGIKGDVVMTPKDLKDKK